MMLDLCIVSFLFALSFWINFYTAPFYFQLDITLPVIIFFSKEYNFWKFVISALFVILLNVLIEKFALLISIYTFIFSLLILYSKRYFNIISIRYIFFSVLIFMTIKFIMIYLLFYRNLAFNKVSLLNTLFDILLNSITSIFIFYILEKLINQLRAKSEKIVCSS